MIVLRREDIYNIPTKYGEGTPLDKRHWCLSSHYIPVPKDCPGLAKAVEACDYLRKEKPSVFWCVRTKEQCKDDADYVANTLYALNHFGYVAGKYGAVAGARCSLQILKILEDSYHADTSSEKNLLCSAK